MTESAPTTAPATRSVIVERVFPHAPAKVWRALTESELIAQWLMANDFKPVVGHTFNFRMTPTPHWNGVTDCRVTVVEPPKRLAYTWESSGSEKKDGTRTLVTFTLTPEQSGTRLRMEHSGFSPEGEGFYQGAKYGWQKFVTQLEEVVAKLSR